MTLALHLLEAAAGAADNTTAIVGAGLAGAISAVAIAVKAVFDARKPTTEPAIEEHQAAMTVALDAAVVRLENAWGKTDESAKRVHLKMDGLPERFDVAISPKLSRLLEYQHGHHDKLNTIMASVAAIELVLDAANLAVNESRATRELTVAAGNLAVAEAKATKEQAVAAAQLAVAAGNLAAAEARATREQAVAAAQASTVAVTGLGASISANSATLSRLETVIATVKEDTTIIRHDAAREKQ